MTLALTAFFWGSRRPGFKCLDARRRRCGSIVGAFAALFVVCTSSVGFASEIGTKPREGPDTTFEGREGLEPLPSVGTYISYGFSFLSETVLTSGPVCPKLAAEACVLGSGGGISFGGSYRAQRISFGGQYAATFHESASIYQRGVLQQIRGEVRIRPSWLTIADGVTGFVGTGVGLAMYGDNWNVSTFGPTAHLVGGTEVDISVKVTLVVGLAYRVSYFRSFTDASGQARPAGLAQFIGLSLGIELHEPL